MGEELALRREVRANLPLQYCSCYAAAALHGRLPRSCTDSAGATSACAGKHQSAPAAASGARFWLPAQASHRPPGHLCAGPSCARERRAPWHVQHTMVLRLCMPHGVSLRQQPNDHSAASCWGTSLVGQARDHSPLCPEMRFCSAVPCSHSSTHGGARVCQALSGRQVHLQDQVRSAQLLYGQLLSDACCISTALHLLAERQHHPSQVPGAQATELL